MVLNSNSFRDVASSAGINWSRQRGDEAISVAWLDYNQDGFADLWISGHGYNNAAPNALFPDAKYPFLYLNNGDGTFTNLFETDWRQGSGGDTHGTNWIDFDNDGDLDVFVNSGGQLGGLVGDAQGQPNYFFVNRISEAAILTEEATSLGVGNAEQAITYDEGRSRATVWFDGNGDGLLDFVNLVAAREDGEFPNAYFEQQSDGTFINRSNAVGFNVADSSRYGQLGDLTGDGNLDLIIQGTYEYPLAVYDFSSGNNFQEVTNNFNFPLTRDLPPDNNTADDFEDHESARDSIIADFDGDGDNDIFLVRSKIGIEFPSVSQDNDRIIGGDLILRDPGQEIGYSFRTTGTVAIDFFDLNALQANLTPDEIFIGAEGRNPTVGELEAFVNSSSATTETGVRNDNPRTDAIDRVAALVLSSNSSGVTGLPSDRSERGVYINYNPSNQTWEVRLNSDKSESIRSAVESTASITNLNPINFTNVDPGVNALTDQLWLYDSNTGDFVDSSVAAGLTMETLPQSAVAGDFDNDKDLDIYIVNSYSTFDVPNILYENQGDGTFETVPMAGGAEGTALAPVWLDFETASKVVTSDYDNDGFLDIFLGSTVNRSPRKTYLSSPSQLFQNQGNNNNWIQIDLQGTQSNRDGIGAQIRVKSGGTTQLREQNGGTHNFAQNDTRLHFGLAQDNIIDRIDISWPSGATQRLRNVSVNQILTVVEPFAERLNGNGGANFINGGDSADRIAGLSGRDTLNGNNGNDSILGGGGADRILGSAGSDSIFGGGGADTVFGGNDNDLIDGQGSSDVLEGNRGDDTVFGANGNDFIRGSSGFDVLNGGNGRDTIFGDNDDDLIAGNDGNDELSGGAGNDTILGGANNDVVFGNQGNDEIFGNDGDDFLNGDNNNDTIDGESGNDTILGSLGRDLLLGGTGNDEILGGEGNDTLLGNENDDFLNGEGGFDWLEGDSGNDTLQGGNGDDTLVGGSGSDRVVESGDLNFTITDTELTGRGVDTISEVESVEISAGGRGNILDASGVTNLSVTLDGGGGIDTIDGGAGNDELIGSVGNDLLTGNGGSDRFIYLAINHGVDTIFDFTIGEDTIAISASNFGGGLTPGILDESQFVLGNAAEDSDDRFIYNPNNDRLLYDSDGTGSNNARAIANFSNGVTLSSQDIEIIA